MNADSSPTKYARTQLEEARRRLESVEDRITETEDRRITGVIDTRNDEFYLGDEIDNIPEEHRKYVTFSTPKHEVKNFEGHIQNIIIDCQMCIELSVKSMFKAADEDFDYSHGIKFSSHNTQNFNRAVPSGFSRQQDIIRAIFLTQLWEKFYEYAKYGAPELNVGPSVIFDIEDGERAVNDASFCVELAEDFIECLEEAE